MVLRLSELSIVIPFDVTWVRTTPAEFTHELVDEDEAWRTMLRCRAPHPVALYPVGEDPPGQGEELHARVPSQD